MTDFFATNDRFLILCDLHANSSEFALACEESGADGVILHLNHDAPGGARFGGLEIEEESIKDSLSVVKIPVGLTIGDNRALSHAEWEAVASLGFSFVNMFAHQFPSFVWEDPRIAKMVSIGPGYILEQVRALSEFDNTEAIIAALTPNQGIGLPLTLLDLTTLGLITKLSAKPVFVPTQRSIRPQDKSLLQKQGCKGLLISSIVYGDTTESCKTFVSLFRNHSVPTDDGSSKTP